MATEVAQGHILAQQRLRAIAAAAAAQIWTALPAYDEANVDEWLTKILAIAAATQRQSVALTEAFLAREVGRRPLGINPALVTGAALRAGTPPDVVYRRPFVTVWTALKAGKDWDDAVSAGLARAKSTAATDVQLAMRATASRVGELDPAIHGFERVPNARACPLCLIASTQRYHTGDLMPIHNRCGCGVSALLEASGRVINRDLYRTLKADGAIDKISRQRAVSGRLERAEQNRDRAKQLRRDALAEADPARRERLRGRSDRHEERASQQDSEARDIRDRQKPLAAEIRAHGELGPVLVNAAHNFAVV